MNFPLSLLPKIRTRTLKLLIPACGILGLILRLLLTITGTDDKGLIAAGHPAWICLWLVTIAAAAILAVGVLPIRCPAEYKAAFPGSLWSALGCILGAVSALAGGFAHLRAGFAAVNFLGVILFYLQGAVIFLAAAAFVLVALCRLFGRKPLFLLHVVICMWFALQMLTLYQTWSFDPQLQEYVFQLLTCIALTQTAYQLAAFDMGKGSHRKLWAWGLTAVYLCCLSASSHLFFVTGAVWAFTNLSNPRRPRQRPVMEAEVPAAD